MLTLPLFLRMKFYTFIFISLFGLKTTASFAQNDSTAGGQHQRLGMTLDGTRTNTSPNTDPRAQWFPKAGLGLFIHWGAVTQYAGCDLSWGMLANKPWNDGTVTPNFYYHLMDTWAPAHFNPNKLALLAKAAGFEYMVLVTKHHDGYTMWPSKYGDLGVRTKMHGHDFVREFVTACRAAGLKVGLYYSPPDWWFDRKYKNWSFNDSVFLNMDHHKITPPAKPADHDAQRRAMVAAQVRELLTQYGKIDLFWFDGGSGEISNEEVRKLQPGIVINGRNGEEGDYRDSEGKIPEKRFSSWFETCDPIWTTNWWSYTNSDTYDNAHDVITELIKLRAWGGNLLGNLAPDADGNIPPQALQGLQEMTTWMRRNGASIHGTQAGGYPETANVPVTTKGNHLYVFFLTTFQASAQLRDVDPPCSAILLRTGTPIHFDYDRSTRTLTILIPPKLRTRMPDVVDVKTGGPA